MYTVFLILPRKYSVLDCWIKQLSSEHIVEILLFYLLLLLLKPIGISGYTVRIWQMSHLELFFD